MTRYLLRFAWLAAFASGAFGADSRCIFVLRDVSPSFYQQLPAANHRIQSLVQKCGPDDQFVIIDVGSRFQPRINVRVQGEMPFSSAAILEPTHNLKKWRDNQALLDALWNDVGGKVQAIKKFLDQPVAPSNSTDLYGALEYCSLRLKQGHCVEAYIFLYTDLHHDFQAVSTDRPPPSPLPFLDANVETFFVPWTGGAEWEAKEDAWRKWFVKQGQARRFEMLTEADSLQGNPLPPNRTPRKVPSPLKQ